MAYEDFIDPIGTFQTGEEYARQEFDKFYSVSGHPGGLTETPNFTNAFMLDTLYGQIIAQNNLENKFIKDGGDLTPIEGYDPLQDADLGNYLWKDFVGLQSPGQVELRKRVIDENNFRRLQLEQDDSWLPRILGNIVDPINLIPVPFLKAATTLKGFKQASAAGFGTFAPFEIARAGIDPTSTFEESALAIGGATLFTGLLGAGISSFGGRTISNISDSYYASHTVVDAANEITDLHGIHTIDGILPRTAEDLAEGLTPKGLRRWITIKEDETPAQYEARLLEIEANDNTFQQYAAVSDSYAEGSELIKTNIGIETIRTSQLPWLLLKNTKFEGLLGNRIRRTADQIGANPGLFEVSAQNIGGPGMAISAEIRALTHNVEFVKLGKETTDAFLRSEGKDPTGFNQTDVSVALGNLHRSLPGVKSGQRQVEFEEDVGNWYISQKDEDIVNLGGKGETYVQNVKEAAEAHRVYYEYMGRQAIEVGMFGVAQAKRKLETLQRGLKDLKEESGKLKDGDPKLWNKNLDQIQFKHKEIHEAENYIKRLEALNRQGKLPETGGGLGHFPRIWKNEVVEARRDDLRNIFEDWFVKTGHLGGRVDEAIGHILGQGQFAKFTPVLKQIMTDAGWTKKTIDEKILEFEELLKHSKKKSPRNADPQILALQSVTPFVTKLFRDAKGYDLDTSLFKMKDLGPDAPDLNDAFKDMKAIGDIMEDIQRSIDDTTSSNFGVATFSLSQKIDIPNALVKDFIEMNPGKVARLYHRRQSVSIEMARRFGGDATMQGEIDTLSRMMDLQISGAKGKLRDDLILEKELNITAVENLRDKVLGVYMMPRDPSAISYRVTQFAKNWMTLSLMGQPIIASLADMGKIQMALGWRRTFGAAFAKATSGKRAFLKGEKEVKMAGPASDVATRSRFEHMVDFDAYQRPLTALEEFPARNVERLFFLNLLSPYTDWLKTFTGTVMQSNIIEISEKVALKKSLSRTETLWIKRAGLGKQDLLAIHSQWVKSGSEIDDILYLANTSQWTDPHIVRKFRSALATEVQNAVITPGATTSLNFMSTNMGSLMTQFKGFSLAATYQILASGLQQRDMYVLQAVSSMIGIGALIDIWKSPDYDNRSLISMDRVVQAIDYSGVTGILFDLNNMTEIISGHEAGLRPLMGIDPIWKNATFAQRGGQAFGPTASLGLDFIEAMVNPNADGDDTARAIRRLFPYNNLLWFDSVVDMAQREVGELFNEESLEN